MPPEDPISDEHESESLPGEVVDVDFALDQYLDYLEAVAETAAVLKPEAQRLDDMEKQLQPFGEGLKLLAPEDVAKLQAILDEEVDAGDGDLDPEATRFPPLRWLEKAEERYGDERWIAGLRWPAFRSLIRARRGQIFAGSVLVSAVGSIEQLFAAVVAYFYVRHPDAMTQGQSNQDGKEFSLKDLEGMRSIEDARKLAVDRRVERLLFKSFDDWSQWL